MERKLLWSINNYELKDEQDSFIGWDREAMREDLHDIISTHFKSDCILIDSNRVDWRGQSGYKVIDTSLDADSLFSKIVSDDYDMSIYLDYGELDTEYIYSIVSSHDIPTGATWNFIPCKDVEGELEKISQHIGDGSHGYNKYYFINKIDSVFPDVKIKDWIEKDVTESCNYVLGEGEKVVEIGGIFTLYLDSNDDITDTIDYDVDSFEEVYYNALRGIQ